jgi:itaconate CoA-transferase
MTGRPPRSGPLGAITVVSVEHAVAAPFATRQLADLGARVIKVERPDGGDFARHYDRAVHGQSSYFVWLNRGKQSIALDLKDPDDRVVLDQLIRRADVFVHNLAPAAASRLGLDAHQLRTTQPRLVHCSISGYGSQGPYRDRKAYDLLIQSETGLLSVTGTPADPARAGISIADIAAGMYAYSGILAALYARELTGTGDTVEVAMLDAMAEWIGQPFYYARYGGEAPKRSGASHPSIAPYGPFRTADGGSVFLAVQNDREWAQFCGVVLNAPELVADSRFAHNPDRVAHESELRIIIEDSFRERCATAVTAALDSARIAAGQLREVYLNEHPQLIARDRWRTINTPGGRVQAMLPPVDFDHERHELGDVPGLGEHTATILAELAEDRAGEPP